MDSVNYIGVTLVGQGLCASFKLSDAVNRAFAPPPDRARPEYASINLDDFDEILNQQDGLCLPSIGLIMDGATMRQISHAMKDRLRHRDGVAGVPVLDPGKTIFIRYH